MCIMKPFINVTQRDSVVNNTSQIQVLSILRGTVQQPVVIYMYTAQLYIDVILR